MALSIPRSLLICMIGVLCIGCGTTTQPETPTPEPEVEAKQETQTPPVAKPSTDPAKPVMNPAGDTVVKTSNVVFPKGKESLETGKNYTIAWESEGIDAFDLALYEFDRPYKTIKKRALAAAGIYEWTPTVELLDGKSFRSLTLVMIDADTQQVHGRSQDTFVIENKE